MNAMQRYTQKENEALAAAGVFNAHIREFYAQQPGSLMKWCGWRFIEIAHGTVSQMEIRATLLNRAMGIGKGMMYAATPRGYKSKLVSTWPTEILRRRAEKILSQWQIQNGR